MSFKPKFYAKNTCGSRTLAKLAGIHSKYICTEFYFLSLFHSSYLLTSTEAFPCKQPGTACPADHTSKYHTPQGLYQGKPQTYRLQATDTLFPSTMHPHCTMHPCGHCPHCCTGCPPSLHVTPPPPLQ